jgi:hypothetical protein
MRLLWVAALWAAAVLGAPRRAVLIDIDGVRRDTFEQAYKERLLPNFDRVLSSAHWFDNAVSVIPTVTMAGQASIFTGVPPAKHGIPGNEWFDRATGRAIDYMSLAGAPCVFGFSIPFVPADCHGGLANRHLQSPTVYEASTAAGFSSTVVFNQYWKGATRAIQPTLSEALSFVQAGSVDYEAFDTRMTTRAIESLQSDGLPSILTVYFAGADGVSHQRGIAGQYPYLSQTIDPLFGRLLDAIEALDPEWRSSTLFILTSDHGRTDAVLQPDDRTLELDLRTALARGGYDSGRIRIAANGGMAYVYLMPGDSWTEVPPAEQVAAAVKELTGDPVLARVIESVRLRDREESPRAGDIFVFLKPDHYFGNSGSGSHHGSIFKPDLSIPLVLAQGGIGPGRSDAPVSNTNIAATIAALLGFPMESAEPPLPGVIPDIPATTGLPRHGTAPAR